MSLRERILDNDVEIYYFLDYAEIYLVNTKCMDKNQFTKIADEILKCKNSICKRQQIKSEIQQVDLDAIFKAAYKTSIKSESQEWYDKIKKLIEDICTVQDSNL